MNEKLKNPWSLIYQEPFSGSSFSPSSQLSRTNSNYFAQERNEGILNNYPPPNWNGSSGSTKPATNYGNNFLPTTPIRPTFDFSTSGPPRATYVPKERTYSAYVEPEIPYKIGRAHMKSNY